MRSIYDTAEQRMTRALSGVAVGLIICAASAAVMLYLVIHFIVKFW